MAVATGPTPQEFLSLPDNLAVLDAFVPDNDFVNLLKDINMDLGYQTLELPAPVPLIHNDILRVNSAPKNPVMYGSGVSWRRRRSGSKNIFHFNGARMLPCPNPRSIGKGGPGPWAVRIWLWKLPFKDFSSSPLIF